MRTQLRKPVGPLAASWLLAAVWSGCYEVHERAPGDAMGTLSDVLAEGPRRLEVRLLPDGLLVAGQVEVERIEELTDAELLGTSIVPPGARAVTSSGGCRGRLTTQMTADLRFDESSTVLLDGSEEISCEELARRIEDRMARGEGLFIFAERPAPPQPQDPEDSSFRATEIQIAGDVSPRETVEMNADADNLSGCEQLASPPGDCLGVLELLGRPMLLQDERTQIELDPRARLDPEP